MGSTMTGLLWRFQLRTCLSMKETYIFFTGKKDLCLLVLVVLFCKDSAYFNGGKEFSITYSFLKLLMAPEDSMNWSSLSFVDSVLEVN